MYREMVIDSILFRFTTLTTTTTTDPLNSCLLKINAYISEALARGRLTYKPVVKRIYQMSES